MPSSDQLHTPVSVQGRRGTWFTAQPPAVSVLAHGGRLLLGLALGYAGLGHLTFARMQFQAQVPSWFPADPDLVVVVSGVVELVLAVALIAVPRFRVPIGWVVAAFFVAVFPGNLSQWAEHRDGFGLDTDSARLTRLFFQPLLVLWALWCTGAFKAWRRRS